MRETLRNTSIVKAVALALLLVPVMASAVERVGDFSLLDQTGTFHNMSWYDDHAAIALLVQANDSSATEEAIPGFAALQAKYDQLGIEFMMINPMGRLNRDEVKNLVE